MGVLYRLLGFVFLVSIGCTDPSEIGASFFKEGSLGIVYTDTLSLHVSTVISDSLITSGSSRLLIGCHKDYDLGKVVSSAFFRVEPASFNKNGEANTYVLDDLSTSYLRTALVLWYDSYSYYDTTNYQTIFVHALSRELELNDYGTLYNISKTSIESTPLGQLTFLPKPKTKQSIEIILGDELGNAIYTKAINGDEGLSLADDFVKEVLKGLAILPDTSSASGSIIGFTSNAELRVYYLDQTALPSEEKYLSFFVSALRYNQIVTERASGPLGTLTSHKESLSSRLTDQKAFIQGGSGLYARVEVPYLKSILLDNPELILTQAELTFKPVIESNHLNTPLPVELNVFVVNNRNENSVGSLEDNYAQGTGYFFEDVDLERDTHYKIYITNFIKSQLSLEEFNSNALLFGLKDNEMTKTVNRLCIGDQNHEQKMVLKLYFAVVR